jgi:hypothetical protein
VPSLACVKTCLLGAALLAANPLRSDPFEAGPLLHEFTSTLGQGDRVEAMGPLLNYETDGFREAWGFSPFMSYQEDRQVESEEFEFLYPFLTYDRFGSEYRFRWFLMTTWTGGRDQEDNSRRRFTIFPFYFQQRSSDPRYNYTAFFPVYGTIRERLQRDEMFFVLFPLYSRTRKRDVITDNYLYPLFHRRHGESLQGWQFWPLLGHEEKEPVEKIDSDGDVRVFGGHDKWFFLWPFYFNERSGIGTTNLQTDRALLPFYSLSRSPARDSSTYLWPLFTYVEDRENRVREWDAPWPLIVFARGAGKTANRVWPFFSQVQGPVNRSEFYLWPLYWRHRAHAPPLERDRVRILFFLYSDLTEKNLTTGRARRRTDLWPLFSAQRDHEGRARLQVLSLLEPLLPSNRGVENIYAPLWSLWRSEKNPKTGCTSESVLWNLYRNDRTPQTRKCSLLFGLFRYQTGPDGKQLRLFYLPVVKTRKPAGPAAGP